MAGPFCTMILADMGAEVVKLERPGRGDAVRAWGDGSERNPYFRYINRNKKGITLDYKQPEGRALFLRLVETMDVLVENYRPTVMPRAGLGFDALREVNPRLIYAQLSGLGYDGPYAGGGGFDLIAQGMGGIMHVTGEPNGPPISVGLPICALGTGMWAVQGILAALYELQRTGKGRLVECSLLETAIGFSSWTSAQWRADQQEPTRQGSRHRQNAPYQRMQTKGRLPDGGCRRRGDQGAAVRRLWGTPSGARTRVLRPTSDGCRTAPHSKPRWRRCSRPTPPSTGSGFSKRPACPAARSTITRSCSPTRRCATAASCNTRAIRSSAKCRTSAPRSRSARACGC